MKFSQLVLISSSLIFGINAGTNTRSTAKGLVIGVGLPPRTRRVGRSQSQVDHVEPTVTENDRPISAFASPVPPAPPVPLVVPVQEQEREERMQRIEEQLARQQQYIAVLEQQRNQTEQQFRFWQQLMLPPPIQPANAAPMLMQLGGQRFQPIVLQFGEAPPAPPPVVPPAPVQVEVSDDDGDDDVMPELEPQDQLDPAQLEQALAAQAQPIVNPPEEAQAQVQAEEEVEAAEAAEASVTRYVNSKGSACLAFGGYTYRPFRQGYRCSQAECTAVPELERNAIIRIRNRHIDMPNFEAVNYFSFQISINVKVLNYSRWKWS
jgi:hypothetical protein